MSPPNAGQTARERARAELTREIKEEARRQLAEVGPHGLSLRAVARELGMVSSALYRYFPSRDDLLTALIIDAYNAIGSAAEAAIAKAGGPEAGRPEAGGPEAGRPEAGGPEAGAPEAGTAPARARWAAACRTIRGWALAHPHEYALIYGSPVPGYRAPEATIGPASRVPLAFVSVLADAAESGALPDSGALPGSAHAIQATPLPAGVLADHAAALSAALSAGLHATGARTVPADMLVRAVIAWTQLFGMVSFELFGQFVGSFEPADALFEHAVAQMATFVGL
jgi:AcrR family transcriptional regulator